MVIGDSGTAYLRSIRIRGIDSDVAYFDPASPPPPMETRQTPKAPSNPEEWSFGGGLGGLPLLISAAVLAAIAYVFFRFGGGVSISFGREGDNASRRGDRGGAGRRGPVAASPGSLKAILRVRDRRAALIQLAQTALTTAVTANGLLLQRSWTARDVLRHLPENQSHIGALRNLVHASERVHFGGRDISEAEFQTHVEDIRPLLTGAQE